MIATAGVALETEDRYLLGCVAANKDVYEGDPGGLLRINNERYYQFIVARSLMSSSAYRVRVEVDTHDLVLEPAKTGMRSAIIEMKRWMSGSGETELPGISADVQKLRRAVAQVKIMLIFSANPKGQMQKQLGWLTSRVGLSEAVWKTYCFTTINRQGEMCDFWIAGCEVG